MTGYKSKTSICRANTYSIIITTTIQHPDKRIIVEFPEKKTFFFEIYEVTLQKSLNLLLAFYINLLNAR